MTAEIAVLNKSAVALAADSAVTIGRGSTAKIYNTVNKIFELSETAPVGVMVYGSMNFMGLPVETIIKQYRKELGSTTFDTIAQYKADLIKYMEKRVPVNSYHEEQNLIALAADVILPVNVEIRKSILTEITRLGRYLKSKDNKTAQTIIKEKIRAVKAISAFQWFSRAGKRRLATTFGPVLDTCIVAFLTNITPNQYTKRLLVDLCLERIGRKVVSSYSTGIVVAGFGDREVCPSLESFETDGIILGRIKEVAGRTIDVDRRGPHADAIGFAQDDMIQGFLNGIDPDIQLYAQKMVDNVIDQLMAQIIPVLAPGIPAGSPFPGNVQAVVDNIKNEQKKGFEDYVSKEFKTPILEMIRGMPKKEISELATALIELTSLKRRVTREQETVGGEVDVAVILKAEGFVWIKRKHYFPANLNPRFFSRHYQGSLAGGVTT